MTGRYVTTLLLSTFEPPYGIVWTKAMSAGSSFVTMTPSMDDGPAFEIKKLIQACWPSAENTPRANRIALVGAEAFIASSNCPHRRGSVNSAWRLLGALDGRKIEFRFRLFGGRILGG